LLATYEQTNFEQIATAIGKEAGQVAKHENQFEAAALWYRLNRRRPTRIAPSNLRRKLKQVAESARRLLKSLGVSGPDEAADGPGDTDILNALVLLGEPNSDTLLEATRQIGRLVEIIDGATAPAEFERHAKKAAAEVTEVGKLTVREGNPGDDVVNDWVAAMMSLYRAGTAAASVPAEPPRLREMLARIRPAAHGVSAKSYSNQRSLLAAALQLADVIYPLHRGGARRHPAWGPLIEAVAKDQRLSNGLAAQSLNSTIRGMSRAARAAPVSGRI
jgi:hypothetical protein